MRRQYDRSRGQRAHETMARFTPATVAKAPGDMPRIYGATDLRDASGEPKRETVLHAAGHGERLHRDRGGEQPRPDFGWKGGGGAEDREAGDGRVRVHLTHAGPVAQQRVRLTKTGPAVTRELAGLRSIHHQRDHERARERCMRLVPGNTPGDVGDRRSAE